MAFGAPRTNSPFTNQSTNPGTGLTAPSGGGGSIAVSAGDLIVVLYAMRSGNPASFSLTPSFTGGGAADTFAALTAPGGNAGWAASYARVHTAGTLTQVAATHTSTSADAAMIVAVFEGPFALSALDKNPNVGSDATSSFDCPLSTTLSQADELVVGFFAGANSIGTSVAATAPATMCGQAASAAATTANSITGAMNYKVVAATTSTSNSFTNASNPSSAGAVGTATFKYIGRRRWRVSS